jgi:tRNA threonylcarbamoyladenosine biosynthesis protein TsaB
MILLGLDTSTAATSVAIVDDDEVLAHREHVGSRDHGAFLAPAIAGCLADAGLTVRDLTGVAVGIGPGLYTGLRVGIATASALAGARELPIVGVGGLDVLARAIDAPAGEVFATVDARRGQVFWARYAATSGHDRPGERREGPTVTTREELDRVLAARTRAALAAGGSAPIVVGEIGAEVVSTPDARLLLALARPRLAAGGGAPAELVPLYLREADVRIGWAERGGGRGGAA